MKNEGKGDYFNLLVTVIREPVKVTHLLTCFTPILTVLHIISLTSVLYCILQFKV
jgi:hypothetical protein